MKRIQFQKDRFLIYFFLFLGLLLVSLFACLLILKHIQALQVESANERYDSYLIANQLRQSSDDLSRMVRLYVVTGEKKYRDHYNEILAIRNGTSPRPLHYDQIYWDLVLDDKRPRPSGSSKSLTDLMIEHGFTLEEFELLRQAQEESNDLVRLEVQAMNAVEGKFDDGTGHYTKIGKPDMEFARSLIFSQEYMVQKAKIMTPIQKFFEHVELRTKARNTQLNHEVLGVIITAITLSILSTVIMIISIIKALKALSNATKESDLLLLNILPEPIANRLKKGEELIADQFPQASVLFADIVGFTQMTFKYGVTRMVEILNHLFESMDSLTEKYGVEKVKTIGDNYMAVSGVPIPLPDHAVRLADFALAVMESLQEFNKRNNTNIELRIGMTYGEVIAGVMGHKKFIYDIWGDVVNTASRMESTCLKGEIQITEKMAFMLGDAFIVIPREEIDVKGKGMMKTYFLKGRKAATMPS